ncbi:MAG TPA: PLD nuclease N-terminal domain-containing protein [Anaerolineae bacterium]|nr:PLD nuclease N-terminal domain-containing protein [Anaerolineae bacterium]HOQ99836.1 PLD nuclease N-terminal domain-containing protein [Anaerolineae bacterium]HPL30001.1 PLD nuclease N-terminal domain-containing protein [Anaerolineae bacterium]
MRQRRQWSDLSTGQKVGTALLGALQVALFGAAQIDLWRRPAGQVRGSKWMWAALDFVNFLGPLAYFAFGRRPS